MTKKLVWIGPGCLKEGRDTIYEPGDEVRELRHDQRQLRIWIAQGRCEYQDR
jgi:hypothetical protein